MGVTARKARRAPRAQSLFVGAGFPFSCKGRLTQHPCPQAPASRPSSSRPAGRPTSPGQNAARDLPGRPRTRRGAQRGHGLVEGARGLRVEGLGRPRRALGAARLARCVIAETLLRVCTEALLRLCGRLRSRPLAPTLAPACRVGVRDFRSLLRIRFSGHSLPPGLGGRSPAGRRPRLGRAGLSEPARGAPSSCRSEMELRPGRRGQVARAPTRGATRRGAHPAPPGPPRPAFPGAAASPPACHCDPRVARARPGRPPGGAARGRWKQGRVHARQRTRASLVARAGSFGAKRERAPLPPPAQGC